MAAPHRHRKLLLLQLLAQMSCPQVSTLIRAPGAGQGSPLLSGRARGTPGTPGGRAPGQWGPSVREQSRPFASVPGSSVPTDQTQLQLRGGELGAPPSPEPLPDLRGKGRGGSVWGPSRTGPAHATAVSFPNVKPQGNFYRENGLERQEESAVRMQAGKWSA